MQISAFLRRTAARSPRTATGHALALLAAIAGCTTALLVPSLGQSNSYAGAAPIIASGPTDCGAPGTGACDEAHATPFCNDPACCQLVCRLDIFCCEVAWDQACVKLTIEFCASPPECRPTFDAQCPFSAIATVYLRSGQVAGVPGLPGQFDGSITYATAGAPGACFPGTLWPLPFAAACVGSPAQIIAPIAPWSFSLPCDPCARWINWNAEPPSSFGAPPKSTLYCHPFNLPTLPPNATAYLTFCWMVDDALGDPGSGPAPVGVYVNGYPIAPMKGGSFSTPTTITVALPAGTVVSGANTLHVYQRETGCGVGGVIYSAQVAICEGDKMVPPKAAVPANLALWLPFDEPIVGTASNPPGPFSGTDVPFTAPFLGQFVLNARRFDRGFVDVPNYAAINFPTGGDFTIDAWVKPSGTIAPVGTPITIVDKTSAAGTNSPGYWFHLEMIGANLASPKLRVASVLGGARTYSSSLVVPFGGPWSFVAVVVENIGPSETVTFRVNGASVAGTLVGTPGAGAVTAPLVPLRVAARSPGLGPDWFIGCIDELEIMNRALTQADLDMLWNAQFLGKCKRWCAVPWDSAFWSEGLDSIKVTMKVCNLGPSANFNLAFTALPAGTTGLPTGCTISGPAGFSVTPNPVFVPAGQCVPVSVTIDRPAFVLFDDVACYRAIAWPDDGGMPVECFGSVWNAQGLCFDLGDPPTDPGGWTPVEAGAVIDVGGTITNTNDDSVGVAYRITVIDPDMEPDVTTLGLNGLPPGEPVKGFVSLAPGGSAPLTLTIEVFELDTLRTYTVLVEADVAGTGTFTPVASLPIAFAAAGSPPCVGDLNGDGVVDGADLCVMLGSWGPCPGCAADLNGDGVVDGADLGVLLGAWGTC